MIKSLAKIAVSVTDFTRKREAEALASQLDLPFISSSIADFDYVLLFTATHLCLQKTGSRELPLVIDFLTPKWQARLKKISLKNEKLARALGLKKNVPLSIMDATGGLLGDSYIVAALGFDVGIFERSPIIHALLEDGLMRGRQSNHAPIFERMHLTLGDAITFLPQCEPPDVIYLDPMFPTRKKSALSKKEMMNFKTIVGEDLDATHLLQTALACARSRVVIKRPRITENLTGSPAPSFSLMGSSCRFDVYMT